MKYQLKSFYVTFLLLAKITPVAKITRFYGIQSYLNQIG